MGSAPVVDYQFHSQYQNFCWSPKHTSLLLKCKGIPPSTQSFEWSAIALATKNIKNIIGDGERKYIEYEKLLEICDLRITT